MDLAPSSGKPQGAGERQAEMLVLGMAVEFLARRLQDMGRRDAAGWYTPPAAAQEKRRFGLSACQAELTGVARHAPSGLIPSPCTHAFGDLAFCQAFNRRPSIRPQGTPHSGPQ